MTFTAFLLKFYRENKTLVRITVAAYVAFVLSIYYLLLKVIEVLK